VSGMAFRGEIEQIDYREDGTIAVVHVVDNRNGRLTIKFELPAEPLEEIHLGQQHALFMKDMPRPTVRIEPA
jgi:hypothetical protein